MSLPHNVEILLRPGPAAQPAVWKVSQLITEGIYILL
jgi:hypothetical protein